MSTATVPAPSKPEEQCRLCAGEITSAWHALQEDRDGLAKAGGLAADVSQRINKEEHIITSAGRMCVEAEWMARVAMDAGDEETAWKAVKVAGAAREAALRAGDRVAEACGA